MVKLSFAKYRQAMFPRKVIAAGCAPTMFSDDYSNLSLVIQPKAVEWMEQERHLGYLCEYSPAFLNFALSTNTTG